MGLDVVELVMEIEEHYGIAIDSRDLEPYLGSRQRPDITVGELLAIVKAKGGARLPRCAECDYSLIGHEPVGVCPECGTVFDDWEALRTIVAQQAGADRGTIRPETLLYKDLKMG